MNKDLDLFLRFYWPSVDQWSINIKDAWKVFLWLDKIFKKYVKYKKRKWEYNIEWEVRLKTWKINNKCTEVIVEVANTVISNTPIEAVATTHIAYTVTKWIWLQEFWKQFFGTLWKELTLKLLWKWKEIDKDKVKPKVWANNEPWVEVIFSDWTNERIELEVYEFYSRIIHDLNYLYALSEAEAEIMKVWYTQDETDNITWQVSYQDKEYFSSYISYDFDWRMWESFKEEEAKEVTIIWQLIEYHWLAHKYHFTFQARKEQEKFWKQKILCVVDEDQHSKYIDLLKPENKWNIKVIWLATFDNDDKVDKMKILNFTKNLNIDPNQESLF